MAISPSFAQTFADTFGAIQQNQRANRQLQDTEIQQEAERVYRQGQLDVEKQKLAQEIDPNTPENIYRLAHAHYMEHMPEKWEAANALTQQKIDEANERDRRKSFGDNYYRLGMPLDQALMAAGYKEDDP